MSRLFRIDCGFQNYDWGKVGAKSSVAQFAAASNPKNKIEDKPYAELWMGTHPSVPSKVVEDKLEGQVLRNVVGGNPDFYLDPSVVSAFGSDKELPFLFKVLSIEKVLLIQAHPDKRLAARLHAADPKNYPDDNHKPEMAIAVTDFEGFCGFKPLEQISHTLDVVPELKAVVGNDVANEFKSGIVPDATGAEQVAQNKRLLQKVFGKVMNASEAQVRDATALLVARAEQDPQLFEGVAPGLADLILRLNKQFPNDIGLLCGCLLLNHARLNAGEAMFMEANYPHAYISGDIIECMAASDNVVRAGFTPKFKDVHNLVEMLTYAYDPVDKQRMPLLPFERSSGDAKTVLYDPPIAEFSVLQTSFDKAGREHVKGIRGPSIVIATDGEGTIAVDGEDAKAIKAGYVYFVAPGTEIVLTSEARLTTYRAFVESK